MEIFGVLLIFCIWHLAVMGLGAWLWAAKPWQWRLVRPGQTAGYIDEDGVDHYPAPSRELKQVRR
jgi:hypothetical protein